jgi:endonuclease YncB( thermonuclease family)
MVFLAAGAAHAASTRSTWLGTVTYVTDGDTLWVRPQDDSAPRHIRIHGIDAPEICQLYGETARSALTAHVLGQRVQVRARRTDQYGRVVARVALQGQDVGAWLVTEGHAWSYRYRHDAGPYAAQESRARASGRGLFGHRNPERPGDFRKRHGSCH